MTSEEQVSRRAVLGATAGTAVGLSGCLRLTGDSDNSATTDSETPTPSIQDSDGDGVIDSEDYAPNDPDVQDKEDVVTEDTETTEATTETTTANTTTASGRAVEGFESGAYDDGRPVTWAVQSPGEEILVLDDLAVAGEQALSMLSGAAEGNHAVLSNRQADRTFADGDTYGAFLRTDGDGGGGRANYRLGTRATPRGPHEIAAELLGDRGAVRVQTRDATGSVLDTATVADASPDTWYRVEIEVRPSERRAIGRVFDESGSELGSARVSTTGESALDQTVLEVPKPGGEQVLGRFDDVVVRT